MFTIVLLRLLIQPQVDKSINNDRHNMIAQTTATLNLIGLMMSKRQPAFEKLRQEYHKFKASLGYIVNYK
jgi:hypothetical protein